MPEQGEDMIRIDQLKIPVDEPQENIKKRISKLLNVDITNISSIKILKRSIDARKKVDISYVYHLCCSLDGDEERILKRFRNNPRITRYEETTYPIAGNVSHKPKQRPVIIGMGPAGLFCGYLLAMAGYGPLLIERGREVEQRQEDIHRFWEQGVLDPSSNVQFGEGGAGTFSDGKLNTLVNDRGRSDFVLDTLIRFGAPEQIRWDAKPHVGTDILLQVVKAMRQEIIRLGGEVHFEETWEGFRSEKGCLVEISTNKAIYETHDLVAAIGHSARDTFRMLHACHVDMSAKEFAVGFRVEHPQFFLNEKQYGSVYAKQLPPAPYKLATRLPSGRGVYSFCMCPGGYVVNATSLDGHTVVNGMSYSDRASGNANSAIVVSVGAGEYDMADPLGAIQYQTALEQQAFALGSGAIPQQLYGDFCHNKESRSYGEFSSKTKGRTTFANMRELLSDELSQSLFMGMEQFAGRIEGFDRYDAILSGIESRTSSPVRIHRDDQFQSNVRGLYPCGEGAGYAGGIMSAAMDGIKVAEKMIEKYQVKDER